MNSGPLRHQAVPTGAMRRAPAEAIELAHGGGPSDVVVIEGFGATRLFALTGAGIRKPKNHRVEFIIH